MHCEISCQSTQAARGEGKKLLLLVAVMMEMMVMMIMRAKDS